MRIPKFKPIKTWEGWRVNVPGILSANGKRSRRFFASRDQAEGFAAQLRAKLFEHGIAAPVLPPVKADVACRAFKMLGEVPPENLIDAVREYKARHNSRLASVSFEVAFREFAEAQPRSESYRQSLRQYQSRLSSLHGKMLCEITARDVEAAMKDFTATVFNFGIRILGGLFNFGMKRDYCTTNPVQKLDRKKLPPREVEIYSPAEVSALFKHAPPELVPWLATCMFAGLRASEARQMLWGDMDFVEGFIRVRAAISKTRRPRAIPMETAFRKWIEPHRAADNESIAPHGANSLRRQLRAAHRDAGVVQIKHGPRHCYASYLLARDGGIDALILNMGHDDAGTTFRHYQRVASRRAAELFWAVLPTTNEVKRQAAKKKSTDGRIKAELRI